MAGNNIERLYVADLTSVDYYALPASNADFGRDKQNDDVTNFSNLGSDGIKSFQGGLKSGSISSNIKWTGSPGYKATIKKMSTAIALTGEAMSLVTGNTHLYEITNPNISVISVDVAPVIKIGGTVEEANIEYIDFLHGYVKFKDTFTVTGAVTADISTHTLVELCNAKEFTVGMKNDKEENDSFCAARLANGYDSSVYGLNMVDLELKSFYVGNTEDEELDALFESDDKILIELNPDGVYGSYMRGLFTVIKDSKSGEIGKPKELSISFAIASIDQSLSKGVFQWYHTAASTMNKGLLVTLNAWAGRVNLNYQSYPKGKGSKGKAGEAIVTDISLSVGVKAVTSFAANLTTTGAINTLAS